MEFTIDGNKFTIAKDTNGFKASCIISYVSFQTESSAGSDNELFKRMTEEQFEKMHSMAPPSLEISDNEVKLTYKMPLFEELLVFVLTRAPETEVEMLNVKIRRLEDTCRRLSQDCEAMKRSSGTRLQKKISFVYSLQKDTVKIHADNDSCFMWFDELVRIALDMSIGKKSGAGNERNWQENYSSISFALKDKSKSAGRKDREEVVKHILDLFDKFHFCVASICRSTSSYEKACKVMGIEELTVGTILFNNMPQFSRHSSIDSVNEFVITNKCALTKRQLAGTKTCTLMCMKLYNDADFDEEYLLFCDH